MPILNTITKKVTKPMPKLLSPKAHAVVDYLVAGSFLALGALFWRHNKRAALSAFICGGSELALNLLTDYPGGVKKIISFPLHRDLDLGLAGMTALMPDFMGVDDSGKKAVFLMHGAGITAVTNLTEFRKRRRAEKKNSRGWLRKAA